MFDLVLGCSAVAALAAAGVAIWAVERYRTFAARLADLERAFPAWQGELSRIATTATEAYVDARDARDRAQRAIAGRASGAARAAPALDDDPPADEAGRREWRDAKKAAIASRR